MSASYDMVIVGAGTAGAATALHAAASGLRVLCLEARPLDHAGAQWAAAIPTWCFEAAAIPLPTPPERLPQARSHRLIVGWAHQGPLVPNHGVLDLHLGQLVLRLQREARRRGAELRGQVRVLGRDGPRLLTTDGPIEARVLVDASGAGGARLLGQPLPRPGDLCHASHELHEVADIEGKRDYFARYGASPEDNLAFMGVQGGFSTLNLRSNGPNIGVLGAAIPEGGHPPGEAMVRRFVEQHPWVGRPLHGGSLRIPLRRPLDRLVSDRVAAVGDAAYMVFPAHGSGVGMGLVAGRLLALSLAEGFGLRGYAAIFMRRYGGTLAAFEIMRRFTQTLTQEELRRLLDSGLLGSFSIRKVLAQRFPLPGPRDLLTLVSGAIREPVLAQRFSLVLGGMLRAIWHYARYPLDPARLPAWTEGLAPLGLEPDPAPGWQAISGVSHRVSPWPGPRNRPFMNEII